MWKRTLPVGMKLHVLVMVRSGLVDMKEGKCAASLDILNSVNPDTAFHISSFPMCTEGIG